MKLLERAFKDTQDKATPSAPRVALSMEDELIATTELRNIEAELASDAGDAERAYDLKECLEDLAFVAGEIREATPREAALIQVAADAATAGTENGGEAIAPSMEEDGPKDGRIKRAIQSIIAALKNFIAMVVDKLRSLTKRTIDLSVNYEARYDALKKALSEASFEGMTVTTKFAVIPGYPNRELDQLPIFLRKYAESINQFILIQGELLRGAAAALTSYLNARDDTARLNALKQLEAVSAKSAPLGRHERYAVPEEFGDGNSMQVRLGISMGMLGDVRFGTSGIKYKISNIASLATTNRQLIVGSDACVVDVMRDVHPETREAVMKVPSQALLKKIVDEMEPLIKHLSDDSSKDFLAGAVLTRADFHEQFSKEMVARIEKLDMEDQNSKVLADGIQRSLAKLAVGSATGYTVLLNNTRAVINIVSAIVRTSIDAAKPPIEEAAK